MKYIKFTDFRNHSKEYFDKIELGSSFIIIRKGKPIAQITPFDSVPRGWKRDIKRVKLHKRLNTTDFIRKERDS